MLFKEQTRNAGKDLRKGGKSICYAFFVSCSLDEKNPGMQGQKGSVHEQIIFRSTQKQLIVKLRW